MHSPPSWVVKGAAEKTESPVADLGYLTEVARLGAGEGRRDFPESTWDVVLRTTARRKAGVIITGVKNDPGT